MNVIRSFDSLKVSEVSKFRFGSESESESEFKFEFGHRILSNVEIENTFQTSILKMNRKKIDSNQSIDQSKNSSISKSIESNESKFLNRIIQSKKFIQKINKSNTHQNSEKKRKIDQLNEMLLFTFSQNRQDAIIAMHRVKSTMKKTYALIQNLNFEMLIENSITS